MIPDGKPQAGDDFMVRDCSVWIVTPPGFSFLPSFGRAAPSSVDFLKMTLIMIFWIIFQAAGKAQAIFDPQA